MAQLTQLANGTRRVQWTSPIDGARRTLYLGKVSKRDAETVCGHVANLVSAQCLGVGVDASTSSWLSRISEAFKIKLARCQLITGVQVPERNTPRLLCDFFESYFKQRKQAVKPATIIVAGDRLAARIASIHVVAWLARSLSSRMSVPMACTSDLLATLQTMIVAGLTACLRCLK